MPQSAVVLCDDPRSLQILEPALKELAIEHVICFTQQQALEPILAGSCSALIADFDLPRAEEVIRMAALLPAPQKPVLLALGRRVWPGTGGAFKSGASLILYKPLDPEQLKDALKTGKRGQNQPPQITPIRTEDSALSRPRKQNHSRREHRYRRARPR